MTIKIWPGKIRGGITANTSKSAMQRACAAALIRQGTTVISNAGNSNDDKAALSIIEALGATVNLTGEREYTISGVGDRIEPKNNRIGCGESGLSIRMFTPIAALSEQAITLNGSGSLAVRPMHFFEEVLPQLGVKVSSSNGMLPLVVEGPLQPQDIMVDGSLSSQFLTGLIMSYAARNPEGITIHVNDLKSKPYIDLTLEVLKDFGLPVPTCDSHKSFSFSHQALASDTPTIHYAAEGDWSGAAFLLVAAALKGEVVVKGLRSDSRQADKKIIDALLDAGAGVTVAEREVSVRHERLAAFDFDATHCPDLFPPLVALAANCEGITTIKGLKRLKHKESDRGTTLKEEFDKLGIFIDLKDDEMIVHGQSNGLVVKNTRCNSHHDHRIAMAVAVAALCADFGIEIRNADAVNKSYPDFWQHLEILGVRLENSGALYFSN